MNGKNLLKALIDGETLTVSDFSLRLRMEEDGTLLKLVHGENRGWERTSIDFNLFVSQELQIVETYDLTFEDAVKSILEGKTVACESDPRIRIRMLEGIIYSTCVGKDTVIKGLNVSEKDMRSGWRITENVTVPLVNDHAHECGITTTVESPMEEEVMEKVNDKETQTRRIIKEKEALMTILSEAEKPLYLREIGQRFLELTDHRGITGVEKSKIKTRLGNRLVTLVNNDLVRAEGQGKYRTYALA